MIPGLRQHVLLNEDFNYGDVKTVCLQAEVD